MASKTYSCAEIAQVGEDLGQLQALHLDSSSLSCLLYFCSCLGGRDLVRSAAVGEFGNWSSS